MRKSSSKAALVPILAAFGVIGTAYFQAIDPYPWVIGAGVLFVIGMVLAIASRGEADQTDAHRQ